MDTLRIRGGKPLEGALAIRGSKNSILPFIAASLLTKELCVFENVPTITDVEVMVSIVEGLGVKAAWDKKSHRLHLDAKNLNSDTPESELSRKLRGSILLAGPLLGRLRSAHISNPGGDVIGSRPLSVHFHALKDLGVEIDEKEIVHLDGKNLRGAEIFLQEPSVTATENAILTAILAPGSTIIRLPAFEPHIQELMLFLASIGAHIKWRDFSIEIEGVESLRGGTHRINPDEIEISSFAALAASTRSELSLMGIDPRYLAAIFLELTQMGVLFELSSDENELKIKKPNAAYKAFRIQSGLYPKLGSDHLPPFAVLATQAEGQSLIHDWLYENRLRYITELQKMGANCSILDPHRALIIGATKLVGCEMVSSDIRSGMTLVVAALVAEGESVITGARHLDRGYEALEERLRGVGADIERVSDD